MEKIAQFEKVSEAQFFEGWKQAFPDTKEEEIRRIYDGIRLPQRATKGSAGYDFYAPCAITIEAGAEILIPSGIRVKIEEGFVLMLFPRSGLGFRYRLQLNNTVGIIDSDYYHADNEGHIFLKLTNDSREGKTVEIREGQGMVQGVFLPFGITVDDKSEAHRHGGFGSTSENEGEK